MAGGHDSSLELIHSNVSAISTELEDAYLAAREINVSPGRFYIPLTMMQAMEDLRNRLARMALAIEDNACRRNLEEQWTRCKILFDDCKTRLALVIRHAGDEVEPAYAMRALLRFVDQKTP